MAGPPCRRSLRLPGAQYLGLARDLTRRLAVTEAAALVAIQGLLRPLYARLDRHPVPRREMLVETARRWPLVVPALGRLAIHSELAGKLGLHALARWFERSRDPADSTLFSECLRLLQARQEQATARGSVAFEFKCRTGHGEWRGENCTGNTLDAKLDNGITRIQTFIL